MPLPFDPTAPFGGSASPTDWIGGGGGYGDSGDIAPIAMPVAPVPPGGRPPGYLIGPDGQYTQGGPATPGPGAAPPNNANAILSKGMVTSAIALVASAGVVALGAYLYQDHAKVTLARNGGAVEAGPAKRGGKKKQRQASRRRDDEDDEDEDEDDDA